jgi:glycine/D-amino acid oxidase-like deaminating enzyme
MNISVSGILGMLAISSPVWAIVGLLIHYCLRRAGWRRRKRLGVVCVGFCPSAASLGTAFQFMQVFHRPSMAYVLEAKQDEDADEDDQGDPDAPAKHLHRQLRRIRRGEQVDTLVLRL